jgi:aspartate racemase
LGIPFHNRREPFTKTLGLLMEFIPFRVSVEAGETFRSLAHKVIQNATEVVSRGILAEGLASGSKSFEVSLNYLNAVFGRFLDAPAVTEYLSHGHDDDTLSLRLEDYEGTDHLRIGFLFNADTFSPQQQRRAVRHFELMLETFLADPGARLDSVDLVTAEEKELLLGPALVAGTAPPAQTTMVSAFEARVRDAPEAIAVVDGDRCLSYGRLNALANQWARRLQADGIHPGVTVGVCMGRSAEWLIALLSVLKSGGAYLPLDPSLPGERLRVILEDAGAPLVLTRHPWADVLSGRQVRLVSLGEEGNEVERLPGEDLAPQAGLTDPAYVIYTSGSTGRPKGVVVEHRSLMNFASWAAQEYGLHPGDRMLQFASISWDTSLEETVPALISGATLVLRPEGMLDSYAGFLKSVRDLGLTVLTFATAFWHELIEGMAADGLPMPECVRLVAFGGERTSQERLRIWRGLVRPSVRLINTYGLTESAPVALWCDLTTQGEDRAGDGVSIGRPIPNMRAFVLDSLQRLAPIGIAGELYLAGDGLARGYLNQAELTAAVFLEGALRELGEKRLLRTGDLARVLPDGRLECLGRVDLQVKVRGHRIEPEEIEAYLSRHPGVREAVVVTRPASPRSKLDTLPEDRLVAYFVATQGQPPPNPHELRNFLRGWLPDFMLPSAYMCLEELPRTPSGKIDRPALPTPDWQKGESVSSFVAPRDDLERRLAGVWERVLDVRPLGMMDDFFDLGGHSLLAIRLFAEIEKETGYHLPVRALFEAPTIEALGRRIRAGGWSSRYAYLVPLQTEGSRPPVFWVHAAGGHVVSFQRLARHLGPEQPSYALAGDEIREAEIEAKTVEEHAARYLREVERIQPTGPYLLGGLSFGGLIALEMARTLIDRGETVAFLGLLDTRTPGIPRRLVSRDLGYYLRQRAEFHFGNLSTMSAQAKLRYVVQRAVGFFKRRVPPGMAVARDTDGRIEPAWPRRIRAGYETAIRAREKYSPRAYPGRITLFRASRQPSGLDDPTLGWGRVAGGGVDILEVPGTHVSIMAEPALTALAAAIRGVLETIRRNPDGNPPT